jgi:hypothetical protein
MAGRIRWLACSALCAGIALGCAGPKKYVTPGPDEVHRLRIRAVERADAERTAIRGAKDYCRDSGQQAVFLEQNTQYTGTMDEATRNAIRSAARAAGALGAFDGQRKPGGTSTGRVLTGGSAAASEFAGGEDYQTDVVFRCR